jgi:hypothetical protein
MDGRILWTRASIGSPNIMLIKHVQQSWLAAVSLVLMPSLALAQAKPDVSKKDETPAPAGPTSFVRVWIAASWPQMQDFNAVLQSQQNSTISVALTVAGELDAVSIPVAPLTGVSIKIPIGAEFIAASSKTTHVASGASATVNWNLPVFGVYLSPRIAFHRENLTINLRPLGIGYYNVGQVLGKAQLSVSDRPGALTVASNAWGYLGVVGVEYPTHGVTLMAEAGYRALRFNQATLTPSGGFTTGSNGIPASAATLPQTLDYSGPVVRVGIGFH